MKKWFRETFNRHTPAAFIEYWLLIIIVPIPITFSGWIDDITRDNIWMFVLVIFVYASVVWSLILSFVARMQNDTKVEIYKEFGKTYDAHGKSVKGEPK